MATFFDLLPDDLNKESLLYMDPLEIQKHPKFSEFSELEYFKTIYLRERAFSRDRAKLHIVPFNFLKNIIDEIDKLNLPYEESNLVSFLAEDEYGSYEDLTFNRKDISDYYKDMSCYILNYFIFKTDLCHGDIITIECTKEQLPISMKNFYSFSSQIILLNDLGIFNFVSLWMDREMYFSDCMVGISKKYHNQIYKLPFDFYYKFDPELVTNWDINLSDYKKQILHNLFIPEENENSYVPHYESFFIKNKNKIKVIYDDDNKDYIIDCDYSKLSAIVTYDKIYLFCPNK